MLKILDKLVRETFFNTQWNMLVLVTKVMNRVVPTHDQTLFLKEAIKNKYIKDACREYSMNVSWLPAVFNTKRNKENKIYKDRLINEINALHFATTFISREWRNENDKTTN